MSLYPFECDCGKRITISASMDNPPRAGLVVCPACGEDMWRDFSGIRVEVFVPFVERHAAAEPVLMESRAQRDAFCKENHITYDSTHWHRRPQYKPASDSVTLDEVMKVMHHEGPPTEEAIQDPGDLASYARVDDSDSPGDLG